ncbi:MAG: delta-aminolevulinic acid dehydratase [Chloroflexi bacterium]|nr:MAG: delta-aminolevulinic acid dehydratase [Chloroflexota bacterium]
MQLYTALHKLDTWIEGQHFKGWDPHDALNSPLLKRLTLGSRWLAIVWVQLLKRSPINLRALLGVPKGYNPKGMGLFLASYLRKYRLSGDPQHLERVRFFAKWLVEHISPDYSGACWGYNFDWPNRGFFAPAGTPTIVNTAFIGLAFLDAQRTLRDPLLLIHRRERGELQRTSGNSQRTLRPLQLPAILDIPDPLSIARSACDFILNDLNPIRPAQNELCFSYTPVDRRYVHNANLMGAWLLAEVYTHTQEPHLAEHALAAARYTARRQRPDGSWPYGEAPNDGWVDNFHTGFVLVALKRIAACLGADEFDGTLARGYRFWKERMFLPDGTPKYYPDTVYPIDAHCVAQAVLTFLEFADRDPEAGAWAWRVARWGIEHMQDPQGYFHYQIHRHYRIRIPYMRWSQAWMQRALTELLFCQYQSHCIDTSSQSVKSVHTTGAL